ncbi:MULTISPECIES: hypothetical protein [unclassified Bradyrhizobium]|nr:MULTISPECIES: hypothetical protein [unclassified Bradyrhizobium]
MTLVLDERLQQSRTSALLNKASDYARKISDLSIAQGVLNLT